MKFSQKYIERLRQLPEGAELYQTGVDGRILVASCHGVKLVSSDDDELRDKIFPFISEGNSAFYLIGEPESGPDRPSYSTAKFGITEAKHCFAPHAHGAKHYVKSEGYAGCLLFDRESNKPVDINIMPGGLIVIPEMMSHSFYNRSTEPLTSIIVNTGLGIYHEEYAITLEVARKKIRTEEGKADIKLVEIINELESLTYYLAHVKPQHKSTYKEHIAKMLRRLASILEL